MSVIGPRPGLWNQDILTAERDKYNANDRNGKFIVRIFGVNDNPKENKLFGTDLDKVEKNLGVKLWEDDSHTLASLSIRSIR